MKLLLPWICVVGLAAGLGWAYLDGQKKDAELVVLREESQQLQKLRTEMEDTKNVRAQAESDELTRLRKDQEELRRLRNEVGQLRSEKQQLATQVQTAQAQVQGAQEQIQALRANPGPQAAPTQLDPALVAAFRARYGLTNQTPEQAQTAVCINNLRLLDGAKQQWALEKRKDRGAMPTSADLAPYLRSNVIPTCPAGGVYTLNPVYLAPLCNIPGHAIPK